MSEQEKTVTETKEGNKTERALTLDELQKVTNIAVQLQDVHEKDWDTVSGLLKKTIDSLKNSNC